MKKLKYHFSLSQADADFYPRMAYSRYCESLEFQKFTQFFNLNSYKFCNEF